jgi:LytS/YehU family sensor histidine kinase
MNSIDLAVQIIQRLGLVFVGAVFCIRFKWIRNSLKNINIEWKRKIILSILFGLLGILATHSGIVVNIKHSTENINDYKSIDIFRTVTIEKNQAIVSFRDATIISAGLIGGIFVGGIAGAISGYERYSLGGLANESIGYTTLLIGIFSGIARKIKFSTNSINNVIVLSFLASALQRLLILKINDFSADSIELSEKIAIPVFAVNIVGCVLFKFIELDIDRDRLENIAIRSEIYSLREQIDPHFFNNALGSIQGLIFSDKKKEAINCIYEIGRFFEHTLDFSGQTIIRIEDELEQVRRFIKIKNIMLEEHVEYNEDIEQENIKNCFILKGCLLTMIENSFKHGFEGQPFPYKIHIRIKNLKNNLIIKISDNGKGIDKNNITEIGLKKIKSKKGKGIGLFIVMRMLRLIFDNHIELQVNTKPGSTTLTLIIPERNTPWESGES